MRIIKRGGASIVLAPFFGFCLLVMVSAAIAAPTGKPFLHGVSSPAELASRLESSLATNSAGTSIIDAVRCRQDGSCAAPIDYLKMFQESDPDAHLTDVAQVPAFLRTLEIRPAPQGEYWVACLKPSGKGYRPVLHCLSRHFKSGEKAWVNPRTGRIAVMADCTNPVHRPVKEQCVEIHFFAKPASKIVRFAIIGPADVSDECIGVKKVGETEFERWWTDDCASADCDFSGAAAVIGQHIRLLGSYVLEPGEHVLRLPAYMAAKGSLFRTVLCLELIDGSKSDGIGVQWFDYQKTKSARTATVWYTEGEIPKNSPSHLYWPWGEWGK